MLAVIVGLRWLHREQLRAGLFGLGMACLLGGICYWKGEPARWRWGG